jgi:D-alanyl-D-alanine carboxypeptidase
MPKRPALVILAIAVLVAGCATQTDSDAQEKADVVSALTATMEEYGVPGSVVAVCRDGEEPWVVAQGDASIAADGQEAVPIEPAMEWGIRSVTKSFTVTLLLQLVADERVSLDDTIDTWVEGIPNGDRITLRQLAAMTSGVPDYTTQAFIEDFVADPGRDFTTDELIDYARAGEPMFEPGTEHVYANSATLLLGEVVEQVTGLPFADVLRQRILAPLGLQQTRYPASAGDWAGPHPTGYQPGDAGVLESQPDNFTVFGPAGAMTSTATDLCRWGRALSSGELIGADLQAEREAGTPLDEGPEYDTYGLGIGAVNGWTGHTGEGFGTTALVMTNPSLETTAVILMNASGLDRHVPTALFREIEPTLSAAKGQG